MIGDISLTGGIVIGHRVLKAQIPGDFIAKNRGLDTRRIPAFKGTSVKIISRSEKIISTAPTIGDVITSAVRVLLFFFLLLAIPLKIGAAQGISDIGPGTGNPKESPPALMFKVLIRRPVLSIA